MDMSKAWLINEVLKPDVVGFVSSCCAHVAELEHVFFSQGQHQTNLPKVQQETQQIDQGYAHE